MDQYRIPCVIMRAGTSKGIFLKENDLPAPGPERDAMILQIFGSPDKRQINGLAGADPLTSKLAVIARASSPAATWTTRSPRSPSPTPSLTGTATAATSPPALLRLRSTSPS